MHIPGIAAWRLELVVVRSASHDGGERRALARDRERGVLLGLRRGVSVERKGFEALSPEEQHVVRMRALAAVAGHPVVFSHWSAAAVHGLPVDRRRLRQLHCTAEDRAERNHEGLSAHWFALTADEVVLAHDLLVTGVPRTVVDLLGATPLEEGVAAADAALHAGLPRELLEQAADLAGPRRASRRIANGVALAHPGAESPAESRGRVSMLRIGTDVPELQQRFVLDDGSEVFGDFGFPRARALAEADGDVKYLDPGFAEDGAARALLREKRREDLLRAQLSGLARFGWTQSGNVSLLRPVLARAGIVAVHPRPTIADFAAAARGARPRRAFTPSRS